MILTVTLNFALDVTYHVEQLRPSETVRVDRVSRRAGGKGVNSARVLHALGRKAVVTGFAGGPFAAIARAELREAGLRDETVRVARATRQTIMVVDKDGGATGFSERGPAFTPEDWSRFFAHYCELLPAAEAVILAGSTPPGLPVDAYGQLVRAANEAEVPVVLDVDGPHLAAALPAAPPVVKVNAAEAAEVTGERDPSAAALALHEAGARAAIVTSGADGLVGLRDDALHHACPPHGVTGNPTGAGDAASAALAIALIDGTPWPEALADAVALSAAAVAAPLAGSFDETVYTRFRQTIIARPLD